MLKPVFVLVSFMVLGACSQTTYVPVSTGTMKANLYERKVEYRKANAMYAALPECAVVWPVGAALRTQQAHLIEESVARHLSGKVQRVIGPHQRTRIELASGYDLGDTQDRKRFAQSQRCDYGLDIVTAKVGTDYLMVWSQNQVGLDLSLTNTRTEEELWRARHIGRRGHGGLPITPVSFGVNMFEAGSSSIDEDQLPSVVDDTLRRMFATFPDLRW